MTDEVRGSYPSAKRSGIWSHHGQIAVCLEGMIELIRRARNHARDGRDNDAGNTLYDLEQVITGHLYTFRQKNESLILSAELQSSPTSTKAEVK